MKYKLQLFILFFLFFNNIYFISQKPIDPQNFFYNTILEENDPETKHPSIFKTLPYYDRFYSLIEMKKDSDKTLELNNLQSGIGFFSAYELMQQGKYLKNYEETLGIKASILYNMLICALFTTAKTKLISSILNEELSRIEAEEIFFEIIKDSNNVNKLQFILNQDLPHPEKILMEKVWNADDLDESLSEKLNNFFCALLDSEGLLNPGSKNSYGIKVIDENGKLIIGNGIILEIKKFGNILLNQGKDENKTKGQCEKFLNLFNSFFNNTEKDKIFAYISSNDIFNNFFSFDTTTLYQDGTKICGETKDIKDAKRFDNLNKNAKKIFISELLLKQKTINKEKEKIEENNSKLKETTAPLSKYSVFKFIQKKYIICFILITSFMIVFLGLSCKSLYTYYSKKKQINLEDKPDISKYESKNKKSGNSSNSDNNMQKNKLIKH